MIGQVPVYQHVGYVDMFGQTATSRITASCPVWHVAGWQLAG